MESKYKLECPPNGQSNIYNLANQLITFMHPSDVVNKLFTKLHLEIVFYHTVWHEESKESTSECQSREFGISGKGAGPNKSISKTKSSIELLTKFLDIFPKKKELCDSIRSFLPEGVEHLEVSKVDEKENGIVPASNCLIIKQLIKTGLDYRQIVAYDMLSLELSSNASEYEKIGLGNMKIVGSYRLNCMTQGRSLDVLFIGSKHDMNYVPIFSSDSKGTKLIKFLFHVAKKEDNFTKVELIWKSVCNVNAYIFDNRESYNESIQEWKEPIFDKTNENDSLYVCCLQCLRLWKNSFKTLKHLNVRKVDHLMHSVYNHDLNIMQNMRNALKKLEEQEESLGWTKDLTYKTVGECAAQGLKAIIEDSSNA